MCRFDTICGIFGGFGVNVFFMHGCMRFLPSMTHFGLAKLENKTILVFLVTATI